MSRSAALFFSEEALLQRECEEKTEREERERKEREERERERERENVMTGTVEHLCTLSVTKVDYILKALINWKIVFFFSLISV